MPLKFFDDTSSAVGNLPFLDDFVKKAKNLKTQEYPVQEIRRVKSDKGYLIITDKFSCFIWKKAKTTTQLIEALDFYINSGVGYQLVVFLPDPKEAEFKLGINFDVEVSWFTSKNGFTTIQGDSLSRVEDPDKNPFLPD